jgi:hypothetical protein
MLSVLSVTDKTFMLNVVIPNAIMLSFIMASVMAPFYLTKIALALKICLYKC